MSLAILFNYHNDARSNKHKTLSEICLYISPHNLIIYNHIFIYYKVNIIFI